MHLEPVRTITDWLSGKLRDASGADQGINVQLAYLVTAGLLDGGDAAPEPVKAVIDSTRDDWLARGAQGEGQLKFPVVLVTPEGAGDWQPQLRAAGTPRDGTHIPIAMRYLTENLSTAKGEADCWYTLRAIVRSLQQMLYDTQEDQRKRNGSVILGCEALHVGPAVVEIGAAAVTGAVVAEFHVRDGQP